MTTGQTKPTRRRGKGGVVGFNLEPAHQNELWAAAGEIARDIGHQTEIVVLATIAGLDAEALLARFG